jgi:hypothetical protein
LSPQRDHFSDGLLLGLMRDKFAIVGAPQPEWRHPAEIPTADLLVGLHLPDAFVDAVAFDLRWQYRHAGAWRTVSLRPGDPRPGPIRSRLKGFQDVFGTDQERQQWVGLTLSPSRPPMAAICALPMTGIAIADCDGGPRSWAESGRSA